MRRGIERYLSRFSYPIFLTYAISYGCLSWVASILPGTIAIRQTEGTCRLGPGRRARGRGGAIQLRLTDGFASFTDENYETRYMALPHVSRRQAVSLSGQARVREIPHVLLHMRENLFIRRKQTREKYFPSVSPLSLIDTCKNVWHVSPLIYGLGVYFQKAHARESQKQQKQQKLRKSTQLLKMEKYFV